jgi:hypothetical protein
MFVAIFNMLIVFLAPNLKSLKARLMKLPTPVSLLMTGFLASTCVSVTLVYLDTLAEFISSRRPTEKVSYVAAGEESIDRR